MAKEKTPNKAKAHTRYRLVDGTIVPGVTTITGLLNKPALVPWANKMGLQGIDTSKYVEEMAQIGTLAHNMILCHYKNTEPDLSDYTPNQIELAENCLLSYWSWEKQHTIEPIIVEEPIVSELMRYGGMPDCYCKLNGKPVLLDFKTGKAIYPEYFYQVSAYANLLIERDYPISEIRILRIGRDEDEGFEEHGIQYWGKHFEIFEHLLAIYHLQKEIKK